jgi:hypothetical protein
MERRVERSTVMTPWSKRDVRGIGTEPPPLGGPTDLLQPGELPSWESFPLPDRRLLVSVIVRTARRQVQSPATQARAPEQG